MNAARLSKLKSYFKSGKKGLEPSICCLTETSLPYLRPSVPDCFCKYNK